MKRIIISFLLFFPLHFYSYDYDLIIIGAGAAGIEAAISARTFQKKVAIIESDNLDSTTVLRNTTAIRSLVHIANTLHTLEHIDKYGLRLKDGIEICYEQLLSYIDHVTRAVHQNIIQKLDHAGIDIIHAKASFIDDHTLSIDNKVVTMQACIIATGSIPSIPKLSGIETVSYLTPENFFEQKQLPKSILIIGAGQLGVEVAISLQRLGCKATLIMKHGLILPTFDYEMVQLLEHILEQEGLAIACGTKTVSIDQPSSETITLTCSNWQNEEEQFLAEAVFIATNRKPNVKYLKLENAGVQYSKKGIEVNEYMQTSCPHIYACGDVVGSHISVRSAYYQARIATCNALSSVNTAKQTAHYKNFTQIIYSAPCYAAIGFTEQDAFSLYNNTIAVKHYNYSLLDKAHIEGNTHGTAKFIFNENDQVIGAHILGPHADELIGWVEIGKTFHTSMISSLQATYPYPSYLDIFWNIASHQNMDRPTIQQSSWFSYITHKIIEWANIVNGKINIFKKLL